MTVKLIKKIKKNIITINIMIFLVAALFFILNKDKFDTYKTYIEYSFHERLILTKPSKSNFFNSGKIKYFLNDLDFNKKFYGITDLGIKNSPDKINIKIDYVQSKIEFTFNAKKKKFASIFVGNSDGKDVVEKNEEIINNFIEESLNKFHVKLYSNLKNEIKHTEDQLGQLITVKSYQLDDIDLINMHILDKQRVISELYEFLELNNNKFIIVNDYSNKFRRLHLNSEEYVISFLILLLLFNFLIKNFNKILR
tara:strand:- start:138 stop:896 length:759 start_codon:yes stop_codon:yes gene_type:complete